MAEYRYFSDWNGETVELVYPYGMRNAEFADQFPGVDGKWYDSFHKLVGTPADSNRVLPVMRRIKYKSRPSRHECDARCMHAKGRTMTCECSCGGANHGKYA